MAIAVEKVAGPAWLAAFAVGRRRQMDVLDAAMAVRVEQQLVRGPAVHQVGSMLPGRQGC
jgi:hypothetical protein